MIARVEAPVVRKYGGSSLSNPSKVRRVAAQIADAAADGQPVVVVVSAMGDTTSALIERAREFSEAPPARELDMLLSSGERMSTALLAMALEELDCAAISLTGPQSGIVTDDNHTSASILSVEPERVVEELGEGRVVVVAGFQGLSRSGEVTTLGRGGSDTTAVALAGALGAPRCEIYSDVAGVYTADPRLVDDAVHVGCIDAGLMSEYALRGARVLHPGCIELAQRDGVAIHAHSTFGDERFTRIARETDFELTGGASCDGLPVIGVTSRKRRLRIHGLADGGRRVDEVLDGVDGHEAVLVDADDVLVDVADVPDPERVTALLREHFGAEASVTESLASVSVIGRAVDDALVERMAVSLDDLDVSSAPTYRTERSVTCAIAPELREDAVRSLHAAFVESALAVGA